MVEYIDHGGCDKNGHWGADLSQKSAVVATTFEKSRPKIWQEPEIRITLHHNLWDWVLWLTETNGKISGNPLRFHGKVVPLQPLSWLNVRKMEAKTTKPKNFIRSLLECKRELREAVKNGAKPDEMKQIANKHGFTFATPVWANCCYLSISRIAIPTRVS